MVVATHTLPASSTDNRSTADLIGGLKENENGTTEGLVDLRSPYVQGVAGFFAFLAVFVTAHQVSTSRECEVFCCGLRNMFAAVSRREDCRMHNPAWHSAEGQHAFTQISFVFMRSVALALVFDSRVHFRMIPASAVTNKHV